MVLIVFLRFDRSFKSGGKLSLTHMGIRVIFGDQNKAQATFLSPLLFQQAKADTGKCVWWPFTAFLCLVFNFIGLTKNYMWKRYQRLNNCYLNSSPGLQKCDLEARSTGRVLRLLSLPARSSKYTERVLLSLLSCGQSNSTIPQILTIFALIGFFPLCQEVLPCNAVSETVFATGVILRWTFEPATLFISKC